jgi:hypothetical protein
MQGLDGVEPSRDGLSKATQGITIIEEVLRTVMQKETRISCETRPSVVRCLRDRTCQLESLAVGTE